MRRAVSLAVLAAAIVVVSLAIADETKPPEEKKPAEPADSSGPAKFNHDQHGKTKKKAVTEENCSSCHGDDPKGALAKPAQSGHKPCMSSGCHIKDFLNTSAAAKKRDAEAYAKAARFCGGCHNSDDGSAPKNYQKAVADNLYKNNPTQEYHVDLDHLKHVELKNGKCRDCHALESGTNKLKGDAPGHLECSQCHTGKTEAHAMGKCSGCHTAPGPSKYFHEKDRKRSDTRACGSPSHLALAKKRKKDPDKVPCFKHETDQHRFWSKNRDSRSNWEKGEVLECGHCHFMFQDKKEWKRLKSSYQTVKEIKLAPMMDPGKGEAHERCGTAKACHSRETAGGPCEKCHGSRQVQSGSLYE